MKLINTNFSPKRKNTIIKISTANNHSSTRYLKVEEKKKTLNVNEESKEIISISNKEMISNNNLLGVEKKESFIQININKPGQITKKLSKNTDSSKNFENNDIQSIGEIEDSSNISKAKRVISKIIEKNRKENPSFLAKYQENNKSLN